MLVCWRLGAAPAVLALALLPGPVRAQARACANAATVKDVETCLKTALRGWEVTAKGQVLSLRVARPRFDIGVAQVDPPKDAEHCAFSLTAVRRLSPEEHQRRVALNDELTRKLERAEDNRRALLWVRTSLKNGYFRRPTSDPREQAAEKAYQAAMQGHRAGYVTAPDLRSAGLGLVLETYDDPTRSKCSATGRLVRSLFDSYGPDAPSEP